MAVLDEITIDWIASPRIIEVDATLDEIDMQDLYDTIATHQAYVWNLVYPRLCDASGKVDLGAGSYSGIVIKLNNAKVKFADRPGPSTVECKIVEGTIKAFDDLDNPSPTLIPVVEPSDYVFATIDNEIGGTIALVAGGADWTDAEKKQFRSALGVDGTKVAATGGQLQDKSEPGDAMTLTSAERQALSAVVLCRDLDTLEGVAPVHSLLSAALKLVSRFNAKTGITYQTDGATPHMTQTPVIDPTMKPIKELGSAH